MSFGAWRKVPERRLIPGAARLWNGRSRLRRRTTTLEDLRRRCITAPMNTASPGSKRTSFCKRTRESWQGSIRVCEMRSPRLEFGLQVALGPSRLKPELRTNARELERRGFMSSTLVGPEIEAPPETDGGGSGFIDLEPGDDGGRGGGKGRQYDLYMTGVWVFMIPIVMFFVGLTSAMIVRKVISDDWISTRLPGILGLNTAVLLASSVTFEMARRAMKEAARSEEHTSELQSHSDLVCRLLLEKKKKIRT